MFGSTPRRHLHLWAAPDCLVRRATVVFVAVAAVVVGVGVALVGLAAALVAGVAVAVVALVVAVDRMRDVTEQSLRITW